jgi:hypothetical protein
MKKALFTLSIMGLVFGFGLQAKAQQAAVLVHGEVEPAEAPQWGRYVTIVHPDEESPVAHEISHLDAGHLDPDPSNADGNYVQGYITVDNVDEEEGYEDEFAAGDEEEESYCGKCDETGTQACHDGEKFYFRYCKFN